MGAGARINEPAAENHRGVVNQLGGLETAEVAVSAVTGNYTVTVGRVGRVGHVGLRN